MIESIVLVGAGNLATQLGKALKKANFNIIQVYSRTTNSAQQLASLLNCEYTTDLSEIKESDLTVISVKDDALSPVVEQLSPESFVVHTAGSVSMAILAGHFKKYGVFYPLQTFSKARDVDFSVIPICLEAGSAEAMEELTLVAEKLSKMVHSINSEKRKTLHLAAVFTCNFVNHFYDIGDQLLQEQQMDFELLKPLVQETAQKVMRMKPSEAQTGPAMRFDESVMSKHIDLLNDKPDLVDLYKLVSRSIYNAKK